MENIDTNNLSKEIDKNSTSTLPTNNSSPYMTTEALFDSRQYGEDFLNMADPAALLNVARYQSDMDKYGPEVFANITAEDPGIVDMGYNPAKKELSIADQLKLSASTPTTNILPVSDPIYSSMKEVNFERYYEHPSYNELGFHPYQNNESLYNTNSSKMDDLSRAYNQFGNQFGTGLTATWNSVTDIFSGETFKPDFVGARSMEDAMRIGSTSRGGLFGTVTNVGLSLGYTAGIITSIALEELALAAGSSAISMTGAGAPAGVGAFIAGTGRNLFRTGKALTNLFDIPRYLSAARAALKTVNNIDNARDFFRVGAQVGGKIFAPEVTAAIENWKTTGNTVQNLFNVTKSQNAFGAVYRDIRQINLALAEGKLEAGMVENRVRENRLRELTQSGERIDGDMMIDLNDKASKAGFRTLMQNTGIIYFSNKLFLKGALRGFRGGAAKRGVEKLYRSNPLRDAVTGKALKRVSKERAKTIPGQIWNELKVSGFKGAPRVFASNMMRYGAGGIAEGLQEVSQEAIAATNEGYYGALLREPGGGAKAFYGSFAMSGIKDQFSSQGIDTFLSGFLMAGLAGPYQQALFTGLPYLYNNRNKNSRQDYAEQKMAEQAVIDDIILQSNKASVGAEADGSTTIDVILDETQLHASLLKNTIDAQNEAESAGDRYEYYNNMFFGEHSSIRAKYENGTINLLSDDIVAFEQMSDQELEEAFPDQKGAAKIREKFTKQKALIQQYGEAYDKMPELFKKRYDPKLFTPGSRAYIDEVALEKAYKHMQNVYMFSEEAFKNALERKTKIAEKLADVPLFGKMAANDITPLLDKESLQLELDRLKGEITILEDNVKNQTGIPAADIKRNKLNLKNKTNRRAKLEAINKVYNSNLTNKGYYDRRKQNNLKGPIKSYLKALAGAEGTYVDNDAVNVAIDEIIDYATLSEDAFKFNQTIDYLLDPNKMEDLIQRSADYFKMIGANKNSILTAQIRDMLNVANQNELINELAKEDVYLDPVEGRRFFETGDINELKTFVFADKVLKLNQGSVLDDQIFRLRIRPILDVYIGINTPVKSTEEQNTEITEQATEEVKDTLEAAGVANIKINTAILPMLESILKKQFNEYQANTFGGTVMNYNTWKKSAGAMAIIEGFQSIQKVWGAGTEKFNTAGEPVIVKPSQSELENLIGFQDFLNSREAQENVTVLDILSELNLNMSLFTTTKAAPSKGVIKSGLVVDLQERVLDPTNADETTSYVLLDKNGNVINDRLKQMIDPSASGMFSNKTLALNAFDLLEEMASDGTSFQFGGLNLSRGTKLVNNSNQFIVNTTFNGHKSAPGIIYLVPANEYSENYVQNSEAAKRLGPVSEQDFIGNYELFEEASLDELGNQYAKLPLDESIKAWPLRGKETNQQAAERLNFIISNLTPLEASRLNIVVRPSVANTNTPNYSGAFVEGQIDKLPNPYIVNKGNDYSIGIQLVDIPASENQPALLTKTKIINLLKNNKNINPLPEGTDGIFAFLPANQYSFTNGIDPQSMSLDVMKSTMYTNGVDYKNNTEEENLKIVRDNFATAETLVSAMNNAVLDPVGPLTKELQIKAVSGSPNYTKPAIKTELGNLKSQSDIVVLDVDMKSLLPTYITSLEGDLDTELQNNVEAGLKKQGILNDEGVFNTAPTNRYNVVVQDASGVYTVATATPKTKSIADLDTILLDYINQAQLVLDTNIDIVDGKKVVKRLDINKEFNAKKRLFIKSSVKGRQFFIDVTPYGSIGLTVKDKVTGNAAKLSGSNKFEQVGTTQYLYEKDFSRDEKGNLPVSPSKIFQPLIDKVNAGKEKPIVELRNFGVSIEQDAPISNYMSDLVTDLDANVFRTGQKLIITAGSKNKQPHVDKPIILNTPIATPKQTAIALERIQQNTPTQVTEKNIPGLVRAWLQTDEGSLANQTAEQSAGKFAQEYNKRNSPVEGMAEDDITGGDIFNVVGQGMAVMDTVLKEIKNQTLRIDEIRSDARLEEAATLPNVLEKIKELKQEIKSTEGLTSKEKKEALKNNKELQALIKQRDELRTANKIVQGPLDISDLETIDTFAEWALQSLPDYIGIADINTLKDNLTATGERVGSFVINIHDIAGGLDVSGTIYTGANSPFRYHEAFHGVYRMLLTSEQQDAYLKIAKKEKKAELRKEGKSLTTELQKFRNSWSAYKNMSQERLEKQYFEEYLADKFEQFKQDRKGTQTSSIIKSFFNKIIEFVKDIINNFRRNELNTLFENIDAGKFRSAPLAQNEFTSGALGSSVEANKLIPYEAQYENNEDGILYIPSLVAEPIIKSMSGIFIERKFSFVPTEEVPSFVTEDQLDIIINQFEELYDTDSASNKKYKANSTEKVMLDKITLAFEDFSKDIKKSINDQIDIIDLQAAQQNSNNEIIVEDGQVFSSLEDLGGLREISQFGKETYLTGGFDNLSSRLRHYLSTVTMPATDYFGNSELLDGTPFVVPVNSNSVYNGILKALQGLEDPLQMIQKLQLFSSTNSETNAAVSSIFNDAGIVPLTEDGDLISELPLQLKNPDFLNKVLKAFTNFRVEWYFQQRDNDGNTFIHSASQRDDASTQIDNWSEAFTSKLQSWELDPRKKTQAIKDIIKVKNKLKQSDAKLQNKSAIKQASEMSENLFNSIGIRLSVGYMKFSLLKNRGSLYKGQEAELSFYPNVEPLTYDAIQAIQTLIGNDTDIFDAGVEGASSRIKTLAENNAIFDETIGASVFKNSNGDIVNSHQAPTYHLTKTKKLNSQEERNRLKDNDFLANNFLLNSAAFNALADNNQLKISRISGTKVLNQIDNNFDPNDKTVLKTMDYGRYTPGEFILTNVNLYLANLNLVTNGINNSVIIKDPVTGIETSIATSPVLIRVIESSNTGDLITLAIVKTMEKVNGVDRITDKTVDVFYNFIKNEYNRIVKERNADESSKNILGYNLIDPSEPNVIPRGFTFANNSSLLIPVTKKALEDQAQGTPVSFEQALKNSNLSVSQFNEQLRNKLEVKYLNFKEVVDNNGALPGINKKIKNGLINSEVAQITQEKYNLKNNDLTFNLKQIFYSSLINTKSINELYLGDQSRTLKDFTSKAKRAKGQNRAGISAYTPLTDPDKGILHATDKINLVTITEPKGISSISGKSIDKADAQMWMTTKAFRHFFFGFGMLSNAQAEVLSKIEQGDKISWDEISNLIDQKGMLNSKKLVYFDGETFLKMSAFVLTPQLTSIKNEDGTFRAKPTAVALHNLRVRLEALEQDSDSVSIAVPLSASKMLNQNVTPHQELFIDQQGFSNEFASLSAKDMVLQQITPSNKREITELSQMKTLSTNEQDKSQEQTIERYNKLLSQRQKSKYFNKRNLSFTIAEQEAKDFIDDTDLFLSKLGSGNDKKITPNLVLFSKYAVNSLKAGASSSNLIEFFTLDKFNQQKYNLNNPYTIAKYQQLFLTYFSQGVFQEKIAGTTFALVSSFGKKLYRRVYSVDSDGIPQKQEVIRESIAERMSGLVIDSRQASDLVGVDIPKEGVVILDRIRYNLEEFDKDGKATGNRYSEGVFPAQYAEVHNLIEGSALPIPKAVSDMFVVRIPSQDKHSAMSIKMVDFLPAFYGSSAMFADELVEISGADFDIDTGYAQRKDFYVEDYKFIEYGDRYPDYINYINREVKKQGTIYKSAYDLYELQGSLVQDSLTDIDDTKSKKAGFTIESIGALQALGLPITKQEFDKYIKDTGFAPYEAPLNNEIVDIRRDLVSNKNMTSGNKIAYTPANLDLIRDAWKDISSIDELQSVMGERVITDQDIDDLAGQAIAFINNKGASIGSVVSPNLYLSLIVEAKTSLRNKNFMLDNVEYRSFGGAKTSDGIRKQDIISSIVTMMTDNAKEYFVAKLGLNSHATGMLTNMIAIGVPLGTSLLLLNNSYIQEQYKEIANDDTGYAKGIGTRVADAIIELQVNSDVDASIMPTREILIGGVKNMEDLTGAQKLGILETFSTINSIKGFTSKLNSVLSLNNGIGKDLIKVQSRLNDIADMEDDKATLNFRPIFKNTYLGGLKDTFKEFAFKLLPEVFITRQPKFIQIQESLLEEINQRVLEFNPQLANRITADLVGYITMSNYINDPSLSSNNLVTEGLNNNLIYPGPDNNTNNVISSINNLKKVDPNNFFLNNYITTLPAAARRNFSGINLVNANSWRKLNRDQTYDLQTSFNKLYNDLNTRIDARRIIAYTFVKDGLQLKSGSILEALSPYVLEDYLSSITKTMNNLDNFNFDKRSFVTNYLSAASNQELIVTKSKDFEVKDMPMVYKEVGPEDPITGRRNSVTYLKEKREGKYPLPGVSSQQIAEMDYENFKELVDTGYTQWLGKNGEAQEAAIKQDELVEVKTTPKIPIVYSENIVTAEGTKGAAQYSNNLITIDKVFLQKKFKEKAWTKPRMLKDGSKANAIAAGEFKTYREFQAFVIEHERQHSLYPRSEFNAEEQPTQQTSDVESENISSKGSGFAKKLTNPGNNLKVTYKGREFRNAEHAYQTYKSGEFDQKAYDSNAFKPVGSKPANRNTNYQTMVDILKAKLEQHPELIEGIGQRGGLSYIEESTHNVTGDKFWESKGQNKFIEALADAYRSTQPAQQTSEEVTTTLGAYETEINNRALVSLRGAKELPLKGSPLQTGIGFIFGELPLTSQLRKSKTPIQKSKESFKDSESFADAAIKQEIEERALSNPSYNTTYDGENLSIEDFAGESAGLDEFRKLETMEANDKKATKELGKEALVIIDDTNLPPIDEGTQFKLDLLKQKDPAVSYPKISTFWNSNIQNGKYSKQVEAFKDQNNVNTLEDLVDLYENNPNSFWASPEGMIEQIKRCNL